MIRKNLAFLTLFDKFKSNSLDLSSNSYGEFDLGSLKDDECKVHFLNLVQIICKQRPETPSVNAPFLT